jgi:hypothetical protein
LLTFQLGEVHETAEQRLWRAGIANIVEEWVSGRSAISAKQKTSYLLTIAMIEPFDIHCESTLRICDAVSKKNRWTSSPIDL